MSYSLVIVVLYLIAIVAVIVWVLRWMIAIRQSIENIAGSCRVVAAKMSEEGRKEGA